MYKNELAEREETFVSTARCDVRTAASLLSFFQQNGLIIRSKSQLFKTALENFAHLVVTNQPEFEFTNRQDALDFLKLHNIETDRNQKTLFKMLQKETQVETNEFLTENELEEANQIMKKLLGG